MMNGIISGILVQKGGVGKSTYANAMAYANAEKGKKTILVDLDPQSTQTGAFMGYPYGSFSKDNISNITNIFYNKKVEPIKIKTTKYLINPDKGKLLQPHYIEQDMFIDFIPSNYELLEIMESDEFEKEEKKNAIINFLESLKEEYDSIIVDAPPSFGIITTAILKCTKNIIVPIPTKNVDTDGMVGFFHQIDELYTKQDMRVLEKVIILPNMFDKRNNDAKATLNSIKNTSNLLQRTNNLRNLECVIFTPFPQRSCIQEAPSIKMFLVPFIMDFSRTNNMDIILQLNELSNELE